MAVLVTVSQRWNQAHKVRQDSLRARTLLHVVCSSDYGSFPPQQAANSVLFHRDLAKLQQSFFALNPDVAGGILNAGDLGDSKTIQHD